jgi:hypothetical protein
MPESKKRPGEPPRILHLYAALATDAAGDEGIVAAFQPDGGAMPLVFSKAASIPGVMELLEGLAAASGETIEIIEFRRVGPVARKP